MGSVGIGMLGSSQSVEPRKLVGEMGVLKTAAVGHIDRGEPDALHGGREGARL